MKNKVGFLFILLLFISIRSIGQITGETIVCPNGEYTYTTSPDECLDFQGWELESGVGVISSPSSLTTSITWTGLEYEQNALPTQLKAKYICDDGSIMYQTLPIRVHAQYTPALFPARIGTATSEIYPTTTSVVFRLGRLVKIDKFNISPHAYKWYIGEDYIGQSEGLASIEVNISALELQPGIHEISCVPVNICGEANPEEPEHKSEFQILAPCEDNIVISIISESTTLCEGDIVQLGINSSYPAAYNVSIEGATLIGTPQNWSEIVEVELGSSTEFGISAIPKNGSCPMKIFGFDILHQPSDVNILSYDANICASTVDKNFYGSIVVSPGANTDLLNWSVSAGATLANTTGNKNTISSSIPGTYTVEITPSNECGNGATEQITVKVLPSQELSERIEFGKKSSPISSAVDNPQTLVVSSCTELLSDCEVQLQELELNVNFGIFNNYYNTPEEWNGFVDIKIKVFGSTGLIEDYDNKVFRLEINNDRPQSNFIDHFEAPVINDIKFFEITVVSESIPADVLSEVELVLDYERKLTHNIKNIGISSMVANPANGWDYSFSWNASPGCNDIKNYQFQLIKVNGNTSPEDNNSTTAPIKWENAVDIFVEGSSFYSLALGQGTGTYKWRVRPVDNHDNGVGNKINLGEWSDEKEFHFIHPEAGIGASNDINYIYSRTFTENGKFSEQLTYADGLQQVLQQQTRLHSPNGPLIVSTQTVQDHLGRNSLTTLPIPLENAQLGYKNLLIDKETDTNYEAEHYDGTAVANQAYTINNYYAANSEENIPYDEGFPFTRTLYTKDGTNRIKEQTGVGSVHHNDKTVKYYYSGVSSSELYNLLGNEAPKASNVQKTIVVDANGVGSVTYTDKSGKTIVTALTGDGNTAGLSPLSPNSKNITESISEDHAKSKYERVISRRFVFPKEQEIQIGYYLNPEEMAGCVGPVISCDYSVSITAFNEETGEQVDIFEKNQASAEDIVFPLKAQKFSKGTWVVEAKVTTYNTDSDGIKYLDIALENYENELRTEYSTTIEDINGYLANGDFKGLKALGDEVYLDNLNQFGYVNVNLGGSCDEAIEVPFYEYGCEPEFKCEFNDYTEVGFEDYFEDYQKQVCSDADLTTFNLITFKTQLNYLNGFNRGDLDKMIYNMSTDPNLRDSEGNPITCEMLWSAWILEAKSYEGIEKQALIGAFTAPNLLNRFLQRLKIKRTEVYKYATSFDPHHAYKRYYINIDNANQCQAVKFAKNEKEASCDFLFSLYNESFYGQDYWSKQEKIKLYDLIMALGQDVHNPQPRAVFSNCIKDNLRISSEESILVSSKIATSEDDNIASGEGTEITNYEESSSVMLIVN